MMGVLSSISTSLRLVSPRLSIHPQGWVLVIVRDTRRVHDDEDPGLPASS
jgi:hypothetical protein